MSDPQTMYAQAVEALNRADWSRAQGLGQRLLELRPDHAGVHFVAGVAALEQHLVPQALRHLNQALRINPQRADYAAQLARALVLAFLPDEAEQVALHALQLQAADPTTLQTLGTVLSQTRNYPASAQAFERAAGVAAERADVHFNLATALMAMGDLDRAREEMEACLARNPAFWKGWLGRAELLQVDQAQAFAERVRTRLAEAGDQPEAQMFLHLALHKACELLDERDQAFEHLTLGKRAGAHGSHYSTAEDEALFEVLEREARALDATAGAPGNAPIFVFGMPRSGTTLAERILTSHPDVHAAGELANFSMAAKQHSHSNTRSILDVATLSGAMRADPRALGQAYLQSTRPMQARKPRFVDKLPHNFLYAGLIANALPDARLICMRRNPMDTCLSNFRQLFALGSPYYRYSFDLLDTGRYYLLFDRLMAHWQALFPGRILEVQYEDLLADQEAVSRQMLAHADLTWDPACLRFERNAAPVATASAVQVREPLNRKSVARWKRYREQLQPLAALLSEAGVVIE